MLAGVLLVAVTNALNDVEAVLVPMLARVALRMLADRFGLLASFCGRVFSVMSTLAMVLNPLGYLLAGVLGRVWGGRVGILIVGGAVVIVSAGALPVPPV